jgi:uncharacterized membrane protein YuzA (DUF378 family)
MMTALSKFFGRAVSVIYILCAVWIVGAVFFFKHLPIPSWVRKEFLLPDFLLLIAGLALSLGLLFLFGKRAIDIKKAFLVAFLVQVALLYCYYFSSGWDAGSILARAWNAAYNGVLDVPEPYYSENTNNLMMHLFEYGVFRLCVMCGIKEFIKAYFALVVINCLVYGLVGVMLYDIVGMVCPGKTAAANLCYCLYTGLVLLSPWASVAYTDGVGILFPTLNVWLFLKYSDKERSIPEQILFLGLLGALSFVCYVFKATTVVSAIAVVIAELLRVLGISSDRLIKSFAGFAIGMVVFAVCFVLARGGYEKLYTSCGIVLDKELSVPFTHYLKIGFNDYEVGTFNFEDAEATAYISDYQQRYDECLSEAKQRIKSLLPFGIFRFEARKALVNYHDGTFSYGIEGDFYADGTEDRVPVVSAFLKRIFWHTGDLYKYLALLQQTLWLVVITGSIFFFAGKNRNGEMVIKITLIGIFLFLALFESRARFIFAYVPIYVAAAGISFARLTERLSLRKERRS